MLDQETVEEVDLSFLYGFICQCPDPKISQAMQMLVDQWLSNKDSVPHLRSLTLKNMGLTNEEIVQMCWLLAVNPGTPASVLEDLCAGASSQLLERIAENSRAGESTLANLACQAIAEVRIATASNANTPLQSIMALVQDENPDVRYSLAENPHIPAEALEALMHDDNPFVRLRAEKTLQRLAAQ